jgi:MFS transporter, AAHS family, 3-hydroxyphenylpropionic acid transporter
MDRTHSMNSTATSALSLPAPRVALTVALCFLVTALEGFDIQVLGVAAPALGPEFGLAPKALGWIFSIGNIGLIFGALLGGRLADHIGRKKVLILSTLVFGLGTLTMSMLHGYAPMMSARFVAGVGFGAALPNVMAIITELGVKLRRGATLALTMCGLPAGGSVVAFISQLLPDGGSWRTLFVIGGVLAFPICIALALWLPDTYRTNSSTKPMAMPVREALFADGRLPRTLLVWIAFVPLMAALYLILNWLPLLMNAKGMSASTAPQSLLAYNLASMVGSVAVAAWMDRVGRRWPVSVTSLLLIASLAVLAMHEARSGLLIASAATGFCLGGLVFGLYVIAAAQYPMRGRGTGGGAAAAMGRVGSVTGPLAAGWLLAGGASAQTVLMCLVPAIAVAGIALFWLSLLDPTNNLQHSDDERT